MRVRRLLKAGKQLLISHVIMALCIWRANDRSEGDFLVGLTPYKLVLCLAKQK